MGNSSLLKGALFVLCVILVIVLFMPKCPSNAIVPLRAHKTNTAPPGLQISKMTAPPPAAPVTYPEGLDAERFRYLIEVDPSFSSPRAAAFSKFGPTDEGAAVFAAMEKLGYIEKQPDGTWAFSREGLLHVTEPRTEGTQIIVPVAKRAFLRATSLDCGPDDCKAEFAWKWQPNDIGAAMKIDESERRGKATLNASDHHWLLSGISDIE